MSSGTALQQAPTAPEKERVSAPDREPASIIRDCNGSVQGTAVVLTAEDLHKLGVSLADVTAVVPRVYKGALLIEPVN